MSQFDFSQHDPKKGKAIYTIPTVPSMGKLHVRFAGPTNREYTNALAKITSKSGVAKRVARGQVDADLLAQNLNTDRALFPLHVITGWEGVKGAEKKGDKPKLVKFDKTVCREFLDEFPDWLMKDLSEFCALPQNFMDDPTISVDEVAIEQQAGE